MSLVLDASALLALLFKEAGEARVRETLLSDEVLINAVNYSEAIGKAIQLGTDGKALRDAIQSLPLAVIPVDEPIAYLAATLTPKAQPLGISLGDRLCLATGIHLKAPVLTADRLWKSVFPNQEIILIR